MRFILVIGMLFAGLVISGTFGQTVFADGPEEPPGTSTAPAPDDITNFLSGTSGDLYGELNPTWQQIVQEEWLFLQGEVPQDEWDDILQSIVPQIHGGAATQGGVVVPGESTAQAYTNSCTITTYTYLANAGWARSVTRSSCEMDYLSALVGVLLTGDRDMCEDCTRAQAYISGFVDECGYYVANGIHEWGYSPTGGTTSIDEGYLGCD